jgi:hypothetical protein
MLPLTVSADTVPLTPSTVMEPAKLSICSRLWRGTWHLERGDDAVRVALGVHAHADAASGAREVEPGGAGPEIAGHHRPRRAPIR